MGLCVRMCAYVFFAVVTMNLHVFHPSTYLSCCASLDLKSTNPFPCSSNVKVNCLLQTTDFPA